MATIQQLDKLHSIKRTFAGEDSLESAVLCQRIEKIIVRTEQLLHQRAFLREERRKLRSACEYLESSNKSVAVVKRPDWLSLYNTVPSISTSIATSPPVLAVPCVMPPTTKINMSGLLFEVSTSVLKRDAGCFLAQLESSSTNNKYREEHGIYYIERDWWLFRYILAFLRDGTLPTETPLLIALYKEANFYNCIQIQHAIEEKKLHLREADAATSSTAAKKPEEDGGKDKPGSDKDKGSEKKASIYWWKSLPSWYLAVDAVEDKVKESKKLEKDKTESDWWLSNTYKGKSFVMDKKATDKK